MSQDGSESEDERREIMEWMITDSQKSQKMENRTLPDHLDDQKIGAKIGHQYHRRTHWIKHTYGSIRSLKKKKKKILRNADSTCRLKVSLKH